MKIFESFRDIILKESEFDKKDEQRILDMVKKSGYSKSKLLNLAHNMANSITKLDKALRRARAAEKHNYHDVAEIFFKRYEELNKTGMRRKIQLFDHNKVEEDVAVRGDVGGMGNVTFPVASSGASGSGDSFTASIIPSQTMGSSYEKLELINVILSKTDKYTKAELELKPLVDVLYIHKSLTE